MRGIYDIFILADFWSFEGPIFAIVAKKINFHCPEIGEKWKFCKFKHSNERLPQNESTNPFLNHLKQNWGRRYIFHVKIGYFLVLYFNMGFLIHFADLAKPPLTFRVIKWQPLRVERQVSPFWKLERGQSHRTSYKEI